MFTPRLCNVFLLLSTCLMLLGGTGAYADITYPGVIGVPDEWADTYTPEEIEAIDRALWAGNMTLEDLKFRKDYTKGHGCFPIVRQMMADPLSIAPDMDEMVAGIESRREGTPSPQAELFEAFSLFPDGDEKKISKLSAASGLPPDMWPFDVAVPENREDLLKYSLNIISQGVGLPLSVEEQEILREFLPEEMAWHDVFDHPYPEEKRKAWEEMMEEKGDDYIFALASEVYIWPFILSYFDSCPDPRDWLLKAPKNVFPRFRPVIVETDYGRIGIGTYRDDKWEGDFAVLIDPGGDDHYINCRIGAAYGTEGRRFGYFADLGGDDFYDCGDVNITLGAAVLGVAAFYDLGQGNDRYVAGSCSLGAAMCGVATFYDDGGSDTYEGKVYTQGAAGFGIGIMVDDSVQAAPDVPTDEETPDPIDIASFDNDRYHAWTMAQALARTLGIAICSNRRGNEIYEAGGVYLHAPLFSDRYQSFSQGFAIGQRGIDYAGGIALIVDYDGNDRYLGDIYNQGVGYWYSAGLLYDGGGNDTYQMVQYGQGSGIHLAIGGLIDVGGNDNYLMHNGLGLGGSHDFAASVLHDRGGDDRYLGNTSCNGGSLTNSAVIFIDRSGNDTYGGRRSGGINFGRPARGFASIGVLVDLEGNDDYLGIMDNEVLWSHTDIGVGWDTSPPTPPEEETTGEETTEEEEPGVELPEIIGYEGELTQEVFDELWDIATRWEVGDNRYIVPKARDRIIAFGPEALSYVSNEFDDMRSGLAIRAFTPILKALMEEDHDGVVEVLKENLSSSEEMRRRVALAEVSDLKAAELEKVVAEILDDPIPEMQRRAISTLGAIDSDFANDKLVDNLNPKNEEALIKASLEVLIDQGVECFSELRPLLEYPMITVRETLVNKLAGGFEPYRDVLYDELLDAAATATIAGYPPRLGTRGIRSLLRIFEKADWAPDDGLVIAVSTLMNLSDWGVRADAIRVAKHWQDLADDELPEDDPGYPGLKYPDIGKLIEPLFEQIEEIFETETEPYVLFVCKEVE